jgi:hypothetical protein
LPIRTLVEKLILLQIKKKNKMNKLNKVKMNKVNFFKCCPLFVCSVQAQDINQVKKIDAEQFQSAKTTLKSIIKMILLMESLLSLGNVYLAQNVLIPTI